MQLEKNIKSNAVILFVGINCPRENDQAFNEWYDGEHIPNLLKFPKVNRLSRFELIDDKNPNYQNIKYPKYLAIYYFNDENALRNFLDSTEFSAAKREAAERWGNNGFERFWWAYYKELNTWE